jgi:hypothetical protein
VFHQELPGKFVHFKNMLQINVSDSFSRPVRRIKKAQDAAPSNAASVLLSGVPADLAVVTKSAAGVAKVIECKLRRKIFWSPQAVMQQIREKHEKRLQDKAKPEAKDVWNNPLWTLWNNPLWTVWNNLLESYNLLSVAGSWSVYRS